jgi:hypothetical protein
MADKIEPFSYMKAFSENELETMKNELVKNSIFLKTEEDDFEVIRAEYKERIKPVKKETGSLIRSLHEKAQVVTEDCFVEYDHDTNTAKYFSPSTGDLVYTRPLYANEMQITIKLQTCTNS